MASVLSDSEAAIFSRLIASEEGDLPEEAARSMLSWVFDERDQTRMKELLHLNQEGRLSADEESQLERYRRVGRMLDLIHSKARLSLRRSQSG
jgi:hypothetical protein